MPGPPFLHGDRIDLHTMEEEDIPFLQETINQPDVRHYLHLNQPLNEAQEREWFDEYANGDESVELIVVDGEGNPVGTVGLEDHPNLTATAEVGLFLAPEYWGQGYGTEASRLMTDYAFDERRMHRVIAEVYDPNEASKGIWESLGFRHESVAREAGFVDGGFVDVHRYAVLEDEWRD